MLQISTMVGCTMGCSYCPQASHVAAYDKMVKNTGPYQMSFETFKSCIDKVPYKAPVCFNGFSEPFLNPHCIEMIEYCRKHKRRVSIQTTLNGIKPDDVDRIMASFPYRMYIHLPDKEGYMNTPRGKDYFEVLEKIKGYHKRGYRIFFNCIGTPIPELIVGIEDIISYPAITSMDNKRGEFNGHDFLEIVYKDVPNEIKEMKDFNIPIRCLKSKRLLETVLIPNGDVYTCVQDYKLELKLCNLLTDTWEDHEEGRLKIIKEQQLGVSKIKCRTCDFARVSKTRLQISIQKEKDEIANQKLEEEKARIKKPKSTKRKRVTKKDLKDFEDDFYKKTPS